MSYTHLVLRDARGLRPEQKLVLVLLAHEANGPTGNPLPPIGFIASRCSVGEGQALDHLEALELHGWIQIDRSGVSARYSFPRWADK